MLRMMDFHRLGVDVRLERAIVVRQGRQGVFGHGVVLAVVVWMNDRHRGHLQSQWHASKADGTIAVAAVGPL